LTSPAVVLPPCSARRR